MTSMRSHVFFTGRNLERGMLTMRLSLKTLTGPATPVSSWRTLTPLLSVFEFTLTSMSLNPLSTTLLMPDMLTQTLFVLNMDFCFTVSCHLRSLGTFATSTSR